MTQAVSPRPEQLDQRSPAGVRQAPSDRHRGRGLRPAGVHGLCPPQRQQPDRSGAHQAQRVEVGVPAQPAPSAGRHAGRQCEPEQREGPDPGARPDRVAHRHRSRRPARRSCGCPRGRRRPRRGRRCVPAKAHRARQRGAHRLAGRARAGRRRGGPGPSGELGGSKPATTSGVGSSGHTPTGSGVAAGAAGGPRSAGTVPRTSARTRTAGPGRTGAGRGAGPWVGLAGGCGHGGSVPEVRGRPDDAVRRAGERRCVAGPCGGRVARGVADSPATRAVDYSGRSNPCGLTSHARRPRRSLTSGLRTTRGRAPSVLSGSGAGRVLAWASGQPTPVGCSN